MGILGWLRGEPSVGDSDYDLYHRVGAQLGKSEKCSLNPGRHAELTDGVGKFWMVPLAGQAVVRVSHSTIEPRF